MAKPRPVQQRSRDRREALLRAALELVAEGGAKAITHRAVAARAGVPLAATTYYFESIEKLTEEALQLEVTERIAQLQAMVASFDASSVEDFAKQLVKGLVARRGGDLIAQYEVYLEAARNPALRHSVGLAMAAFEQLATRTLAALGAPHPEQTAMAFVALTDGFALHRVARPVPPAREAEAMFRAIRALFIAEVMEPEELARWDARLRQALPRRPEGVPSPPKPPPKSRRR